MQLFEEAATGASRRRRLLLLLLLDVGLGLLMMMVRVSVRHVIIIDETRLRARLLAAKFAHEREFGGAVGRRCVHPRRRGCCCYCCRHGSARLHREWFHLVDLGEQLLRGRRRHARATQLLEAVLRVLHFVQVHRQEDVAVRGSTRRRRRRRLASTQCRRFSRPERL